MTHGFDFDPPRFARESELNRQEKAESLRPIPGQLSLEPLMPKPGSVKSAVLHLLQSHPEGMCRRDFANEDIYELSNRVGELQADGWVIEKLRCERHGHKQRFTLYRL